MNLKILLDRAVAAGAIDRDERNELLAAVDRRRRRARAARQLRAERPARHGPQAQPGAGRRCTSGSCSELEQAGELDRALEFLPTDKELARREADGIGLVSPENWPCSSPTRRSTLTQHIEDSTLPDEPWFQRVLRRLLPAGDRRSGSPTTCRSHPLHREIITTVVVNDMINRGGHDVRAPRDRGDRRRRRARSPAPTRSSARCSTCRRCGREIEALDNVVPTEAQHAGYQEIRRLIDRATRWLVDVRFPITDVAAEIERFGPTLAELAPRVPDLLRGAERQTLYADVDRLVALGLPRELALRLAELLSAFLLLDVVEIANATDALGRPRSPSCTSRCPSSFSVDELLTAITELPRDDRWSTLARAAMRHDVYAALSAITTAVLRTTDDALPADERIDAWAAANAERVERARTTVARGAGPRRPSTSPRCRWRCG